ncbi:MAG: DUF3494 domain-containing protein [Thermoanaerobaculia bacterium]|nr:DUF3494 domain-containing protein [Thermoanaerobaculia bacterium]
MGTRHLSLSTVLMSAALLFGAQAASGQPASAPPLGVSLPQFGVLGGAAVTGSTGAGTVVNGDVGSSPTPAISNFLGSTPPGPSRTDPTHSVHYTNDAVVQQAILDARAAWVDMGNQGALASAQALGPELSGQVLTSGIFNFASAANLASPGGVVTGTLTLNGPGIFIFNVGSSLTANVGSIVTGTANPCNVYWRMGGDGSATLNGVNFWGTVIADQSVTVSSATTLTGRAVGIIGAVTMPGAGGNTIGGCSSLPGGPPGPGGSAGGSTLDSVGMAILLGLLALAGVFAVNRFTL